MYLESATTLDVFTAYVGGFVGSVPHVGVVSSNVTLKMIAVLLLPESTHPWWSS